MGAEYDSKSKLVESSASKKLTSRWLRKTVNSVFFWQFLACLLAVSLVSVALMLWIVISRNRSPLATISALPSPQYAQIREPSLKCHLTLLELLEGMYSLSGDPQLLFESEQAAKIAAVLPLARQFTEEGRAGKLSQADETDKKVANDMVEPLKDYLWSLLRSCQQNEISILHKEGRLTASPQEALRFLPEFYTMLCQDCGLRDDFSDYGLSPMRERFSRLRMLHWLVGVILLETDPEYAINEKQAALLKAMEQPLKTTLALDFGKVRSAYFPVLESQVRSVLTEKQQQRLLELLWEYSVLSLKLDRYGVMRSFHAMLTYKTGTAGFDLNIEDLLRTPGEEDRELSVATSLPNTASVNYNGGEEENRVAADIQLRQAICGIIYILERDPKLRLSEDKVRRLIAMQDEINTCLDSVRRRVVYEKYPQVQAEVINLLNQEQILAIASDLANPEQSLTEQYGEEIAIEELDKFLRMRRENNIRNSE